MTWCHGYSVKTFGSQVTCMIHRFNIRSGGPNIRSLSIVGETRKLVLFSTTFRHFFFFFLRRKVLHSGHANCHTSGDDDQNRIFFVEWPNIGKHIQCFGFGVVCEYIINETLRYLLKPVAGSFSFIHFNILFQTDGANLATVSISLWVSLCNQKLPD